MVSTRTSTGNSPYHRLRKVTVPLPTALRGKRPSRPLTLRMKELVASSVGFPPVRPEPMPPISVLPSPQGCGEASVRLPCTVRGPLVGRAAPARPALHRPRRPLNRAIRIRTLGPLFRPWLRPACRVALLPRLSVARHQPVGRLVLALAVPVLRYQHA